MKAMVELGNKHECLNCGTKFYDLGKSDLICPSCEMDQAEIAEQGEGSAKAKSPSKKKSKTAAKKKKKKTKTATKKKAKAAKKKEAESD